MRIAVLAVVVAGVVSLSIDDLVYTSLPADTACVRLLTRTGQVGCGVGDSRGVLYDVDDVLSWRVYDPSQAISVLMPHSALNQTTIDRLQSKSNLAGIFLHSLSKASPSDFHSPAEKLPFSYLSTNSTHIWNPSGTNLTGSAFGFGIVTVADPDLPTVMRLVEENRKRIQSGLDPRNQAQFNYPMDAGGNSVSCLQSGNCLPIGGYNVWSSRAKIDNSTTPIVAAVTQMDASAFIHAHATGANSAMSGLLALLGASDAISRIEDLNLGMSSPQIVFAAFNGEFFDLIGSRSFVKDLSSFSCRSVSSISNTLCLDPYRIDTSFSSIANLVNSGSSIIEISQVGNGQPSDPFYFHTTSNTLTTAINSATQGLTVNLQPASAVTTIGLPPSSALAFPASVEKLVLTGYDTEFNSLVYGSELDANFTDSSIQRICSASTIVARTLLTQVGYSNAHSVSVNCTLIKELSDCVGPLGFECDIAGRVMASSAIAASSFSKKGAVSHYASVYQQRTPSQVTDTPRFVYDWWTSLGLHAYYHDAVDPDLSVGSDGFWKAADGPGRLWTESNWVRQRVRLYVTEAPWTGAVMFGLGCIVAAASVASSFFLSKYALRTIKMD